MFEYHILPIFGLEQGVAMACAYHPQHSVVELTMAYKHWVHLIVRYSSLFYDSLYQYQREIEDAQFDRYCEENEIYSDETRHEAWSEYPFEYREVGEKIAGAIDGLEQFASRHPVRDRYFWEWMGPVQPRLYNEIWFNWVINNTDQERERLARLPYDQYLKTSHWRRVRSAMLIVRNRTCSATDCDVMGEPLSGVDMVDLHVHHVNYVNRGNERFKDLLLLCKRHHLALHNGANLGFIREPG